MDHRHGRTDRQGLANKRKNVIASPWIEIRIPQQWMSLIEFGPYISHDGTSIVSIALETAQMVFGSYYHLETIKAMDVVQVIAE